MKKTKTNHVFSLIAAGICFFSFVMLSCGGGGGDREDAADTPVDEIQEPVSDIDALEDIVHEAPQDFLDTDAPDVDALDTPAETPPEWEGIHCGGSTCSVPQVCCFEYPYYYANARCADPSDCTEYVMECDGAEDCNAGETCCVADPSYPASACQTASCDKVICHIDEQCPSPQLCCPHPFIDDNFISYCTTVSGTDCPE